MNSGIPNVSLVDAEIVFLDQGGETISLILSGKKRHFMWALSGDVAVKVGGASSSACVCSSRASSTRGCCDVGPMNRPENRYERLGWLCQKRSIEQTIQKLQNLHARLSA